MSFLCPASTSILALKEEDLGHLGKGEKFVEHRIDIQLNYNLTIHGPGKSNSKLVVISYENGTTKLCGSCSFCNLLADSIQRSVESPYEWDLYSKIDLNGLSKPLNLKADIHFEKLKYQKDGAPWAIDKRGLQSMRNYDVCLLLLTGYVVLYSFDTAERAGTENIDVDIAFELFGEEDDPVVKLLKIHRRPLHGLRLADQNVAKMREWIMDCDDNHERCLKHMEHGSPRHSNSNPKALEERGKCLPTRMIDVGDTSSNQHPRLVITSEIQPGFLTDTKYMALSYCWGLVDSTSKLLKTTHDTLNSRTEAIGLETMPQTFQDAIEVARTLNIQYLWIDSLCIIQDDARDWQIESSRMAQIFSNAYLTLAAASGSGCNDSFLDRSQPDICCTVPLSITSQEAIQGQFSLRFRPRWRYSDKLAGISSSKWVSRGWTFQEERLARRILTFGENKFFFDCSTLTRYADTDLNKTRPDWATVVTEGTSEPGRARPEVIGDRWQTLCAHYSFRELTFPEDKLPAISGMANKIARKIQSEYFAGLWRANLMHDLFWQTVSAGTKPEKYRAPSWSWASVDGRVRWPLWPYFSTCTKCNMYCTVLDVQVTRAGLDPFGAVKDGILKIKGVLKEMKVVCASGEISQIPWRLEFQGVEIGNVILDIENENVKSGRGENVYQALLVAECTSVVEESKAPLRGLLLERKGRKRGSFDEFERVGTFTLHLVATPGESDCRSIWEDDVEQVIIIV